MMNATSRQPSCEPFEAPAHVPALVGAKVLGRERWVFSAGLVVPVLGVLAALAALPWLPPTGLDLALGTGLYVFSILGIGVGYHRYFTHRSFEAVPVVKAGLAIAGCMAAQGPLNFWIAQHRYHHQHADDVADIHTPHHSVGRLAGMWHAHCGWFFGDKRASAGRYARDILQDRLLARVDALYPLWLLLTLGLPALAGLLVGGAAGALRAFLWAGLVRIFFGQHFTYAVNSICHLFGTRVFRSDDRSVNNLLLALPTLGESLHNSHHAFPSSPRFSFRPFEVDLCWGFIRLLTWLKLASRAKVPSQDVLDAKRLA